MDGPANPTLHAAGELDVKTEAALRDDRTDTPDGIFTLRLIHDAASARAMLRLVQELPLRGKKASTPFYIYISPESIQQMQLVGVARHPTFGNAYELYTVLHLPPELIGPPWDPWTGRNPDVDQQIQRLEALADMLCFTLFIPARSMVQGELTAFCHAVSAAAPLQTDTRLRHLRTLYAGKGFRKYEVPAPTYSASTSASSSRPPAHPTVTTSVATGVSPPPPFLPEAGTHNGSTPAPASQPKRPRSDTSNSPVGGTRKLPRMSLSPPPLKAINDRLDALQSHLMSVFEEPLRVSAQQTQHMKTKLCQIHKELEEYLADQDSVMEEMEDWEDTILELKDTVDKMSESLQDAEMRLNDLEGTTLLEAAMESSETLQEWVKDYVDESVGQLLDDAVANAFLTHFADVTAAVSLFQGVVQQVTGSDKVRAGIMSKADDTPSPSRRGSGQHTTTPTIPQALGQDDSTESDSSTSSPARPAADDAGNEEERPADTAVPEKFTTARKQTAAALETMASASVRIATAMERIAQACEASYVPAKRCASRSSDESSITFRWDRKRRER